MVTRDEATTVNMVDGKSVEELALDAESAIRDGMKDADTVAIDSGLSGSVEMLDAGHSWVYDVRNYDRSKVNNNMLRTQLQKTDTDVTSAHYGRRVFTTENLWAKGLRPVKGTFKCFLHKDSPDREKWNTMGYAVCPAGSLASPSNQESHAKRTHKAEWAAIQAEAERTRQQKADQLADLNIAALLAQQAATAPPVVAPVVAAPVETAPEVAAQPVEEFSPSSGTCPKCDWTNDSPKPQSRRMSFFHHNKTHE
jgi:hypothetical protein